uniref:Uncharacterized protein n=1 Tax=viral metagenome TaxID=1070528 RepID=A0A6M3LZ90_9ZZZZ
MDTSRIENRFLKENQLLGLGFPGQGYIFMRCTGAESIFYEYDESPGAVAANTQEDASRLPISAYSIDNLLRVEDCDHIYQVFMGWKPGAVRQYLYYPYETARRNLDVKRISTKSPFGYMDGFESPYDSPSPETEMFIPKDIDVAFAWWNPLGESVTVEEHLLIRRLKMDYLRDADLIERILKGTQPCRITTLGGIGDSFDYKSRKLLDIDFVKLGASRADIEYAVK